MHPVELHAHAVLSLPDRVDGPGSAEIDDVIGSAVAQLGERSSNTTRQTTFAAGLLDRWPR